MKIKRSSGFARFGIMVTAVIIGAVVIGLLVYQRNNTKGISKSASADRTSTKVLQTKTDLRLRWMVQSQFAGIYWAAKKGIFEKEGLQVAVNPAGPGINFMQLVGSGTEEFGICAAPQIIEARAKGVPVVALAIIFQANPVVFFAKQGSGIKSPLDWVGKTVAVFNGYEQENVYRALLKKAGLDPKRVKEYPAKFDMTPFFRDEVDVWSGYVINQPNTAEEKGFAVTRIFPDDYGVHLSGDTLFTTEKVIREKPELVQKIVNSVLAGWTQALSNQTDAVNLVLSIDPKLDRQHETKMIEWVNKLTLTKDIDGKIGWMTGKQWKDMIDLWREFGGITADINPHDCYNPTFIANFYQGR